jgi:hypothetical protein
LHIVDALIAEVRGIVVEAEARMVAHSRQGAFGGGRVEGDLGGMHLEREPHAALGEHVEDRVPPLGELGEAGVDPVAGDAAVVAFAAPAACLGAKMRCTSSRLVSPVRTLRSAAS